MVRFAVITDTHFVATPEADSRLWNRQLITLTPRVAESLVTSIREAAVDFVVHCGDLTHDGDFESLEYAREVFRRFGCPTHVTVGNHDVAVSGAREHIASLFGHEAPVMYRAVRFDGLRILILDSCFGYHPDGTISPEMKWRSAKDYLGIGPSDAELQWLREEIADDRTTPTIAVIHLPLVTAPSYPRLVPREPSDPGVRNEPTPEGWLPRRAAELRGILAEAPNLRVVVSGHLHLGDLNQEGGVLHCSIGSLIEFPFEYRIFEVQGSGIQVTCRALPDAQELNLMSLVPEWENGWVRGPDRVRGFSLS